MTKKYRWNTFAFLALLLITACRSPESPVKSPPNASIDISFAQTVELSEKEKTWLAADHTVCVRVGNWPPFMFVDHDAVTGISIDYLEGIFAQHGIQYRYRTDMTWAGALKSLENHDGVDLAPTINRTPQRETVIAMTDDYLFAPRVIFTRDDADFISRIDDLNGKTVVVENGYVTQKLLQQQYPEIKLMALKQGNNLTEKCLDALSKGQADAYIGNLAVASYLILRKGIINLKIAAPAPFANHNQAMGIRNDWPELVSIINKHLAAITPSQHAAIRNKWLSMRYEHGIRPGDVLKWVSLVIALAGAIIGVILFWNSNLKREIRRRQQVEKKFQNAISELIQTTENLENALANIKTLKGLLPICSACKKIRDDSGYWHQVEEYVGMHTDADFSHGICPECAKRLYPDIFDDDDKIFRDS